MGEEVVIFDCEYLAVEGSLGRRWSGPSDPDPLVVQIGAVRLALSGDYPVLDTQRLFLQTVDRHGRPCRIDPFLTGLTGITDAQIAADGVPLADALERFERFARGHRIWSWGKDELNLLAVSCYIAGCPPPIAAQRFDNACRLLLRAGMPPADLERTSSGELAAYYGLETKSLVAHDALDDALSVTYVLQHLLRTGRLSPADFRPLGARDN